MQSLPAVLTFSGIVALLVLAIPLFKLWSVRQNIQSLPNQMRIAPVGPIGVRDDYHPLGIELDLETALIEQ